MTYQLRPYQSDLLEREARHQGGRINKSWFSGTRSIVCQLPTGGGKTILFATAVHEANQNGLKCLILAHREELIIQAADKIENVTNNPNCLCCNTGTILWMGWEETEVLFS
jgi:superfamily II DNA or RNA helicase